MVEMSQKVMGKCSKTLKRDFLMKRMYDMWETMRKTHWKTHQQGIPPLVASGFLSKNGGRISLFLHEDI